MKRLNVAICDDELFFIEQIHGMVEQYSKEREIQFEVSLFSDGRELVDLIEKKKMEYQVIFLDIEMPGMSGVEIARRIRLTQDKANICFITSHEGYALNAFEVEAIGYVVKPGTYEAVKRVLEKAVVLSCYELDHEAAEQKYLEIPSNKSKTLLEKSKIIYIEKCRNQCVIHLVDGKLACYETLSNLHERLNSQDFIYVHQGYIVNFTKIKEVKNKVVCMGDGIEIPVSRRYYQSVKEKHMDKIYMLRKETRG